MTSNEHDPRIRRVELRDTPLSVQSVLDAVADPAVGGVGLFVGQVREQDHDKAVEVLDYSAHPSAVERMYAAAGDVLTDEIRTVAVEHRIGRLAIGDIAVVVAVGAAHRGPALRACADLIDVVKSTVPIWKHQVFRDGTDEWVGV